MHYDIEVYSGNEFFWECLRVYWSTFSTGIKLLLAGYLVLVVLILIFGTKKERTFFGAQLAVLILCPLNPVVAWQLVVHLDFATRYFRLFWMIPVALTYAYVFVKVWERLPKAAKAAAAAFAAVFFVWSCRQVTVWTAGVFTGYRPNTGMMAYTNVYKVEDDVIQAADAIEKDAGDRYATKRVLYDYNFYLEVRAYDGSFQCLMQQYKFDPNREYSQEEYEALFREKEWRNLLHYTFFNRNGSKGVLDVTAEDLELVMDKCKVEYVIVPKDNTYYSTWLEAGEDICDTEYYSVVKNV